LSRYVERFWVGRVSSNPAVLLPGTGCDVLFPLTSSLGIRKENAEQTTVGKVQLFQLRSGTLYLTSETEDYFLSVRFRTGALRHFVPGETTLQGIEQLSMDNIWGNGVLDLGERVISCPGFEEMARLISEFLLLKFEHYQKDDVWIDLANQTLYYHHHEIRIEQLADRIGVTRRHLERRFRACYGLTPIEHQRLCRMQQTIRNFLISEVTLPDCALDHGYFDYAHFSKEFERILGCKLRLMDWTGLKKSHFYNHSRNPCSMLYRPSKVGF